VLETHEELLDALRAIDGLKERSAGRFYRRSRPFLHFHGRGAEMRADLRIADEWEPVPAGTPDQRAALLARVTSLPS
jgi:hypothetical protein